jgi:hypothetical protein
MSKFYKAADSRDGIEINMCLLCMGGLCVEGRANSTDSSEDWREGGSSSGDDSSDSSESEGGSFNDGTEGGGDASEDHIEGIGEMHMEGGFEHEHALNDESQTPLFCGSPLSRLDATLLFMNVCRTHKATNACINELLQLLAKVMLPTPNSLPSSEGVASRMLGRLGLRYNAIDACKNGCVLYRQGNAELDMCPICQHPRFRRVGLSRVPHKVLRHFPLIPRLRRMFSTPHLAALMTWHENNVSNDGKMRGPYDSPQWQHIREKHPNFAADSRNVHLGLCADGLNPHGQKRSTHSLCPVLLLNYNIPPWLTIKKNHHDGASDPRT